MFYFYFSCVCLICCAIAAGCADIGLLQRMHSTTASTSVVLDYSVLAHPKNSEAYAMEVRRVIDTLKMKRQFNVARIFATVAGIVAGDITVDEVRCLSVLFLVHTGTSL